MDVLFPRQKILTTVVFFANCGDAPEDEEKIFQKDYSPTTAPVVYHRDSSSAGTADHARKNLGNQLRSSQLRTSPGLVEDVRVVLPAISDYDGGDRCWKTCWWSLFKVADVFEDGCRQIKYALTVRNAPEEYWFLARCGRYDRYGRNATMLGVLVLVLGKILCSSLWQWTGQSS